jgi:hypothetical protein
LWQGDRASLASERASKLEEFRSEHEKTTRDASGQTQESWKEFGKC